MQYFQLLQLPAFMLQGSQGGPPGHDPTVGFSSIYDDDIIDRVRGLAGKKRAPLSPPPVPDNLCELRTIVSEIFHATENSQYVTPQVKDALRDCMHHLEAECNTLTNLTHLGHRAAEYSRDVLYLRMQFFAALERRIEELSQLQSNFAESRDAFHLQPTKQLLEGIHGNNGDFNKRTFLGLKPQFKEIERYYHEICVALLVEEEYLRKIYSSLRVTPGDRLRWEDIRDACRVASTLLTPETAPVSVSSANQAPPPPPFMPPQTSNKAARYIRALAQAVTDARQSLLQTRQGIVGQLNFSLRRLQADYENSRVACRERIEEVHSFSEDFLQSFVEVPPLDDFHVDHIPSAAAESSRILKQVRRQVRSTQYAVLYALPQLKGHFSSFERCHPTADASMQRLYATLPRLVLPLQQPDDRHQGLFRTMNRDQLRAAYDEWREIERKWAAAQPSRGHYTSSR